MKKLVYIVIAALAIFGCGKMQPSDVHFIFEVSDMTSDELVLVYDNALNSIKLNDQGHAEYVLPDVGASYVTLYYAGDLTASRLLYIEGGDILKIKADGRDFFGSVAFEGGKAAVIEYLNTIRLTALPDDDYALSLNEFKDRISRKENEALKLMKANELGKSGLFRKMEEGRIRYSYGAQMLMYPLGHRYYTGEFEADQAYYDIIETYFIESELWIGLDQYREFILEASHVLDAENRNVSAAYPKAVAQMKFIADRFSSQKIRNVLLHYIAYAYVDRFGVSDIQDMENIYRTYVKDEALVQKFDEACAKWNMVTVGKPSPDFKAVDIKGKEYTLADFRGRYVYIDVWATWCGPCRQEMPHLKALEERYKDAAITFVSLSVDQDKSKWENMLENEAMSGVQLYLGNKNKFLDAYRISSIPRFILLDKEGNVLDNDMSRPSSEVTVNTIDALEGIR